MVLSIGIDYGKENWKTCLMENGRTLELRAFNDAPSTSAYLKHTCAFYPEPIVAISLGMGTLITPLNTLSDQQLLALSSYRDSQRANDTNQLLIAIGSVNLNSYTLPGVRHLPSVPAHRKRHRLDMGSSDMLCAVATLLYHMRKQEAIWQEMRFMYVDVEHNSRSIIVVEDGRIVNGLGESAGTYHAYGVGQQEGIDSGDGSDTIEDEAIAEQAFWEGLTQDLAGLMAIHHLEDIVVTGQRKDAVIERLEGTYQFYCFPHHIYEQEGFEAAIGAAIIAEGLYYPGLAAEIVERLQLSQAGNRSQNQFVQTPSLL